MEPVARPESMRHWHSHSYYAWRKIRWSSAPSLAPSTLRRRKVKPMLPEAATGSQISKLPATAVSIIDGQRGRSHVSPASALPVSTVL